MKHFKHSALYMVSMFLMAIAGMATTNSSNFMWHETECPKELLK